MNFKNTIFARLPPLESAAWCGPHPLATPLCRTNGIITVSLTLPIRTLLMSHFILSRTMPPLVFSIRSKSTKYQLQKFKKLQNRKHMHATRECKLTNTSQFWWQPKLFQQHALQRQHHKYNFYSEFYPLLFYYSDCVLIQCGFKNYIIMRRWRLMMSRTKTNLLVQPADAEYPRQHLEPSSTVQLHTNLSTDLSISGTILHDMCRWINRACSSLQKVM